MPDETSLSPQFISLCPLYKAAPHGSALRQPSVSVPVRSTRPAKTDTHDFLVLRAYYVMRPCLHQRAALFQRIAATVILDGLPVAA